MPWATYLVDMERDEEAVHIERSPPTYVCGIGRGTWRKIHNKSEIKMPSNAVRSQDKEHPVNFRIPKMMGRGRGMFMCNKAIGKMDVKPGSGKLTAKIAPTTQPRKPPSLTDYKLTTFVDKTASTSNQHSWAHRAGTLLPELETVESFNKKLDELAGVSDEETPVRRKKTAIVSSFDLVDETPDEDKYASAVGGVPDISALSNLTDPVKLGKCISLRRKELRNAQSSIYENRGAFVPISTQQTREVDVHQAPDYNRDVDVHQAPDYNCEEEDINEEWNVEEAYRTFVNEPMGEQPFNESTDANFWQKYLPATAVENASFYDQLFAKGPCVFEVYNLPYDISEATLYEFMCSFGEVILCAIERFPSFCNGARARVRMVTKRGCEFAIKCLHGEVSPFPGIYKNDIIPFLVCNRCD